METVTESESEILLKLNGDENVYKISTEQHIDENNGENTTKVRPKVGRKGVAYEKSWSSQEIERLIYLWHERAVLYDSSLPEHMDTNKRDAALRDICDIMELSEDVVLRKMRSLRSYYGMLNKQIAENEKKGVEYVKPAWPFYDSLVFLNLITSNKPREAKRKRYSEPAIPIPTPPTREETVPDNTVVSTSTTDRVNEDELFGQLVTRSLKKIPEGDEKEEAKIEIQQVILAAKKRALEKKK